MHDQSTLLRVKIGRLEDDFDDAMVTHREGRTAGRTQFGKGQSGHVKAEVMDFGALRRMLATQAIGDYADGLDDALAANLNFGEADHAGRTEPENAIWDRNGGGNRRWRARRCGRRGR
jgi:hypothetical protein